MSGDEEQHLNRFVQKSGAKALTFGVFCLCVFAVLPAWSPWVIDYSGLDGSYRAVLNTDSLRALSFGDELVTTAGPFGWLRNRDYWPGRPQFKLMWDFGIGLSFLLCSAAIFLRRNLKTMLVFAALALALFAIVKFDPERFSGAMMVWYLFTRLDGESWLHNRATEFTAIALSLASWILFPYLLMATIVVVFSDLGYFLRFRRIPWSLPLYFGFLALGWAVTGQGVADLFNYVSNSLEVAKGYAESHTLPGGWIELSPLVTAAVLVGLAVLTAPPPPHARKSKVASACSFFALGVVFFLGLKSAFIRWEWARTIEFSLTIGMAALFAGTVFSSHFSERKAPSLLSSAAMMLVMFGVILNTIVSPRITVEDYLNAIYRIGTHKPRMALRLPERWTELEKEDAAKREAIREDLGLGGMDGTFDLHGSRSGILVAAGVDYDPRPVFQSFQAGTPALAELNARHLRDPNGPDYLIVETMPALGFPVGLLDSRAWLEVFQSFEPVRMLCKPAEKVDKALLLKRAQRRRTFDFAEIASAEATLGESIRVPETMVGRPLWAQVEVETTVLGRLTRTFLKLPRLSIHLEFRDGSVRKYAFSSVAAHGGFLLSPQVRNPGALERLLVKGMESAAENQQVVSFSIVQADSPLGGALRGDVRFKLSAALEHEIVGRRVKVDDLPMARDKFRFDRPELMDWQAGEWGDEQTTGRILVSGALITENSGTILDLAVAVDDRIVGVATCKADFDGDCEFSITLARSDLEPGDQIQVLVISQRGTSDTQFLRPRKAPDEPQALAAPRPEFRLDSEHQKLMLPDGRPIALNRGLGEGRVDIVTADGPWVTIAGWAFSPTTQQPAESVVFFVGDRFLAAGRPTVEREDVASVFGEPARVSGFAVTVGQKQYGIVEPSDLSAFGVFGDSADRLAIDVSAIHLDPNAVPARQ